MTDKEKLVYQYIAKVCYEGNKKVEILKQSGLQKTYYMSFGALKLAERFMELCDVAFTHNITVEQLEEYIKTLK